MTTLIDETYDHTLCDGAEAMLSEIFSCGLILVGWTVPGPAGVPSIKLRGTPEQHATWRALCEGSGS